jgi:Flp pilus assembly protein TadG
MNCHPEHREGPASRLKWHSRLPHDEHANAIVESALVIPILVLALIAAVDFSRAYYAQIEINSAAQAGANYGLANINDTAGMKSAAVLDAPDVPTLTATATTGCECADGSNPTPICTTAPTCSTLLVDYIEVDTSAAISTTLPYPGLPSTLTLTGKAHVRSNN